MKKTDTKQELDANRQQLIDDLQEVVTDAQNLIKSSKDHITEEYVVTAKEKIKEGVEALKSNKDHIIDWGNEQQEAARKQIRSNPMVSVGVAAAVGLIAGVFINRR